MRLISGSFEPASISALAAIFRSLTGAISCRRVRLSRTGFLDTFDPFDSSYAELPGDVLDLA